MTTHMIPRSTVMNLLNEQLARARCTEAHAAATEDRQARRALALRRATRLAQRADRLARRAAQARRAALGLTC
jgi:hypothetical protein